MDDVKKNLDGPKRKAADSPSKIPDKKAKEEAKEDTFSLVEKSGDLFSAPPSNSLCHCISRDCKLGKVLISVMYSVSSAVHYSNVL